MSKNSLVLSTAKGNVILPDFSKKDESVVTIADEPRRLKIVCFKKKNKTTNNLFNSVTGYVKLECFDIDGKSEGVKTKGLQVHFRKDAFQNAINVHTPNELKSGYLYVKAKGIQIPNSYKVTQAKDENGELMYDEDGNAIYKYPCIWIQSDVIGLEEMVTSQTALNVDEDEDVVDAETNEVVDEETGEVVDEDIKQYDYNDESDEDETSIK